MTKDTEALGEALFKLSARLRASHWIEDPDNHAAYEAVVKAFTSLATPASAELGFDPTMEVGDEVFPHDAPASDVAPVGDEASALRVGWWNDMRARGVSQDDAIAKIKAATVAHPHIARSVDPVATYKRGVIVGEYSTALTPEDYAVESATETGSVQIYPAKALRPAPVDPVAGEALRATDSLHQILNMDPSDMVKSPSYVRSLVREALAALKGPAA